MFIHRLNSVRSALGLPWADRDALHISLDECDKAAGISTNLPFMPVLRRSRYYGNIIITSYERDPKGYVGARLARLERHVYGEEPPVVRRLPGIRTRAVAPPYFWLGAAAVSYPTLRPGMDF